MTCVDQEYYKWDSLEFSNTEKQEPVKALCELENEDKARILKRRTLRI